MAKEPTIHELLKQAVSVGQYEYSGNTGIYSIPDFPDYLLRIEKPDEASFKKHLSSTTSLTPVHLCARNVGQKLLDSGQGVQIILKVPGKSLDAIYQKRFNKALDETQDDNIAHYKAGKHLLTFLCGLEPKYFARLCEEVNYLTSQGITADVHVGNILYDKQGQGLRLIDVHDHKDDKRAFAHRNSLELLTDELCLKGDLEPYIDTEKQEKDISQLREQLTEKLKQAAKGSELPKTRDEIESAVYKGKIKLKTLAPISNKMGARYGVHELKMDAPISELRAVLEGVKNYSAAKER